MRKGIAITLIVFLMIIAATPVFAANTDLSAAEGYSTEIQINATTSGSDKYSVDVEWGNMEFTYTVGEWDTANHKYITADTAVWESTVEDVTAETIETGTYTLGSGQILVRNHSNKPITTAYSVTSAKPEGFDNVEAAVTAGGDIEACEVLNSAGNAGVPYQTATVTLTGAPTYRQEATVGTLTINISKK